MRMRAWPRVPPLRRKMQPDRRPSRTRSAGRSDRPLKQTQTLSGTLPRRRAGAGVERPESGTNGKMTKQGRSRLRGAEKQAGRAMPSHSEFRSPT